MKKFLLVNLLWVWLMPVAIAQQQVSGKVTDFNNEPLPGVNILIKNTSNGTITDIDGNYSLEVPGREAVLVYSFIGYESQEIVVENQTTIDVQLVPDLTTLNEVVVVGYGTQKKSDVTGSLVSVDDEIISEVPVASNVASALKGRLAGVQIQSTSSRPGGETQIRIRGNRSLGTDESGVNDPLIVLDGIPFSGNLGDINPSIIASVNVLKDASATAIYGSRGANGVILITTKRGDPGKARISYNGYYGISSALDHYDLYNSEEYADLKQVSDFQEEGGFFTANEKRNMLSGKETDWQDLLYKNGFVSNHDLSVSGGTEQTQYSVSAGYFKETTVLPGQSFERYSLRSALDQKIGERIRIGLTTMNSVSVRDGENVNPMFQMLTLSPLYDAYTADGQLNIYPAEGSVDATTVNPLTLYREDSWSQTRRRLRTFNSLYAEVDIIDGLKYRLNLGLDYSQDEYGHFYGAITPMNNGTSQSENSAAIRNRDTWSYTVENLLIYEKAFGDHTLNFTGLFSVQEEEMNRSGLDASAVYADYLQFYNFGLAGSYTVPDDPNNQPFQYTRWGLMSGMGRINYSFKDRYLATITVRADGSSRLSEGNKWFVYPAGALAWNIHNEAFMDNANVFSNLKLRLGLGRTSNQAIAPYSSLGQLGRMPYNFGDQGTYGFLVSNLPNEALGWEFTTSANIGLDFGLFTNRIMGSVDLYKTNTEDVLQARNLPVTAGVPGNIRQNIGETESKGIELMLSALIIESRSRDDFGWDIDLNFTAHQEKIVKLADTIKADVGNGWFVGEPVNVIYDYEKIGIWQLGQEDEADAFGGYQPGDVRVADNNPNGVRDPGDRVIIGQLDPKWTAGFTTRFTFKGFDLAAVLYARVGGKLVSSLYQADIGTPYNTLEGRRNGPMVDYWTVDNPTNAYPRTGLQQPEFGSTLGYFDATYLKIRSINLGYTLPDALLEKAGIGTARIYVSADNPFKAFFSDYVDQGGIDPEPSGRDSNNPTPGLGRRLIVTPNTPITKTFLIGVNITF